MYEMIEFNPNDVDTLIKQLAECSELVDDIARAAMFAADDLEEAWEHPEYSSLTTGALRNEGKNLEECALVFSDIKRALEETMKKFEQAGIEAQSSCSPRSADVVLPKVVSGAGHGQEHGVVKRKSSESVTSGATGTGM